MDKPKFSFTKAKIAVEISSCIEEHKIKLTKPAPPKNLRKNKRPCNEATINLQSISLEKSPFPFFSAGNTLLPVDADYTPARRAFPFYRLIFNKIAYSFFFNAVQVFNHAHAVFGPVSFIKLLYSFTRE
jgi:hypothetical protein